MSRYAGRQRPYLQSEIRKVGCVRCGRPSHASWQACADGRTFRPFCKACDVDLNAMVLFFMRHPEAAKLARNYRRKLLGK